MCFLTITICPCCKKFIRRSKHVYINCSDVNLTCDFNSYRINRIEECKACYVGCFMTEDPCRKKKYQNLWSIQKQPRSGLLYIIKLYAYLTKNT